MGIKKSKEGLYYVLLLGVVFLFSYLFIFDKKLDLNGDNFGYLNYAKAILDGHGYVSPYSSSMPPTNWFPPGYSAFLASLMFIFGQNILLFKFVNGLLYFGSICLIFELIKQLSNNKSLAYVVPLLLIFNSGLMRYATILMSEIPYLFLSTIAIFSLIKLNLNAFSWKNKWFWGLVLGSVGAFYFRSVALGLVVGACLYFLFAKQWKLLAAYLGGFILLYLPWAIRDQVYGLKGRYLDTITVANAWRPEAGHINTVSGFLEKMALNFEDTVIRGFTEVLFPFAKAAEAKDTGIWIVGLIILAITIFGAWKTSKFRVFFVGYILANIGVFLLWHSGNGARYVWPLAPFIAVCFFLGLYELITWVLTKLKQKPIKQLPYAFLLVVFLMLPKLSELNVEAKAPYYPAYKNYFDIAAAVKKNVGPDKMVCCRKAEMFHYFSGTYTIMYKFNPDRREVIKDMIRNKVDYVVLEQLGYSSTNLYLYPAIEAYSSYFKVVMKLENPETYLLAFDRLSADNLMNELDIIEAKEAKTEKTE